jgi:hypothetical protein
MACRKEFWILIHMRIMFIFFAHQLQLVVVSVASSACCQSVHDFFEDIQRIVSTTSSSCKRRDALKTKQRESILEKLERGEIFTGKGIHQETNLARPGDTRWGSHYLTLIRLETMWESVLHVLAIVHEDGRIPTQAAGLIEKMETFKFAFILKLMLKVLAVTNELSQILQRKNVDIVIAMELLDVVKARMAMMRTDSGWESFFEDLKLFCAEKHIPVVDMDAEVPIRGRSRRDGFRVTNLHYYRTEIFFVVLDKINTELCHRFSEVSSELLVNFSCLDPKNSFCMFNLDKLVKLGELYDQDFTIVDRAILREQLETYIVHIRLHSAFSTCEDIASLAIKMVQTGKHVVFPLVYKLIELALLLPVSTASVERSFSAMNIIKRELRNKIEDDWMNDLMVCYTEKEIFKSLDDEIIIRRFQRLKTRRMQFPSLNLYGVLICSLNSIWHCFMILFNFIVRSSSPHLDSRPAFATANRPDSTDHRHHNFSSNHNKVRGRAFRPSIKATIVVSTAEAHPTSSRIALNLGNLSMGKHPLQPVRVRARDKWSRYAKEG